MARWAPNAAKRLEHSALDLFYAKGFDAVTVAQIADRASMTERTFFRYFATKEDVLFGEGNAILEMIRTEIAQTPKRTTPGEVVRRSVGVLAASFENDRSMHRKRVKVIASTPSLLERDLLKQHQWSATIATDLSNRGVPMLRALTLAAAVVGVFRTVYAVWATDRANSVLGDRVNEALDALIEDLGSIRKR